MENIQILRTLQLILGNHSIIQIYQPTNTTFKQYRKDIFTFLESAGQPASISLPAARDLTSVSPTINVEMWSFKRVRM